MITKNELNISNQSYTNKDFYQIYPEVLDYARQLSKRWDPKYSNESDPGVVILKLICFIADKLNYNIDKNVLEWFALSATQEDSMSKICDMMGYNMNYYESATGEISFMCLSDKLVDENEVSTTAITLEPFKTVITDETGEIIYTLVTRVDLNNRYTTVTGQAMQGQYIEVKINADNILRASNLDDKNRFYLPETMIAQNGIWITDASDSTLEWERVENLNTQLKGSYVWKFEYDSKLGKPYIQFPEDAVSLLSNGVKIGYIRTNGASGNVSAKTLCKLQNTTLSIVDSLGNPVMEDGSEVAIEANNDTLIIQNSSAIINGKDKETLDEAYDNYKRTVGTFDTLITCRDYANAIYNLVFDENTNNNPLVSNIQVSDINDDINLSTKIATFDGYGITYQNVPETVLNLVDTYDSEGGKVEQRYVKEPKISNFDIYLYPLNPISNYTSDIEYKRSFLPNNSNLFEIKNQIDDYKCLSHNLKQTTSNDDVYLIKNYYDLSAKITTTYKVNNYEILQIKQNIFQALFENFNARKLAYGEEIPYDQLIKVITNADSRIKYVNLDEPTLKTYYMLAGSVNTVQEGLLKYKIYDTEPESANLYNELTTGQKLYLKYAAKNVLSGKIPLYDFNKDISLSYNETLADENKIYGADSTYPSTEGNITEENKDKLSITAITTNVKIPLSATDTKNNPTGYELTENQMIQLICPKLLTKITYPVNVNYFFKRDVNNLIYSEAVPAYLKEITFEMANRESSGITEHEKQSYKDKYGDGTDEYKNALTKLMATKLQAKNFDIYTKGTSTLTNKIGKLVGADYSRYVKVGQRSSTGFLVNTAPNGPFYYLANPEWNKTVTTTKYSSINGDQGQTVTTEPQTIADIAKAYSINVSGDDFSKVDIQKDILDKYFTQTGLLGTTIWESRNPFVETSTTGSEGQEIITTTTTTSYSYDVYTLGSDFEPSSISKGTEYCLRNGDQLYINYTEEDGTSRNILYTETAIYNNGILDKEFNYENGDRNIIKPNFDLIDSEQYHNQGTGHTYSKTTGLEYFPELPGMFSFTTSQQIEIRDFSKSKLTTTSYLYWICNNNNTLTFTKNINVENEYEYILEDGEYLFYTNSAKTYLVTYGSGTKLVLHTTSSRNTVWNLNSQNTSISTSNIASNGIAAFADTDWMVKNFTSTDYLTIEQMNITTLVEGNNIMNLKLKDTDEDYIDSSKWYVIDTSTSNFTYNDNKKLDLGDGNDDFKQLFQWKIRTILNLNVGPNLIQKLRGDICTESVSLFTSRYRYIGADAIVPSDQVKSLLATSSNNITEEIISDQPLKEYIASNDNEIYLKSNYLLERMGGKLLNAHRKALDGTQTDDLMIYQFTKQDAEVLNYAEEIQPLEINSYKNKFTRISLNTAQKVKLPLYIPENNFALVSIYYNKVVGLSNNYVQDIYLSNPVMDSSNITEHDLFIIIKNEDILQFKIKYATPEISINANSKSKVTSASVTLNSTGRSYNVSIKLTNGAIITFNIVNKSEITTITESNIPTQTVVVKLKKDNFDKDVSAGNYMALYSDRAWRDSNYKSELYLKEGMNVIQIKPGSEILSGLHLEIDGSKDNNGLLTIANIDLVNYSQKNPSGVDTKTLGIYEVDGDLLLDEINAIDTNNQFYYNLEVDNSVNMDIETLDNPYSWFNKNNVVNKFVISEINTRSLENIEIAKSSRLTN